MKKVIFVLTLSAFIFSAALSQNKPFPQMLNYPGCIKPDNYTPAQINKAVSDYYDYWKSQYLKSDLAALPGGYYVKGGITGDAEGFQALGSSEGMGYGMIITVLMAGYDANAKMYFDGLYKTLIAFKSSINANLMGWVVADAKGAMGHFDSATDGDLDMAYALLLAHYQWGSAGTINYLAEAKRIITQGLKQSNVTNNNRLNLGDWDDKNAYNTRPSDWMMSHMRAFYQETTDPTWLNVVNNLYAVYKTFSTTYSPSTGLLTDFIIKDPPEPCPANFLNEYPETKTYSYNACRFPLRIVLDFALYSSTDAYAIADKLVTWVKQKSSGNPATIKNGYKLDGTVNATTSNEAVFIAPFVAASIISTNNQAFLNNGWNLIKNLKNEYFNDSYNMLCMLLISGNWWKPETATSLAPLMHHTDPSIRIYPNPTNGATSVRLMLEHAEHAEIQVINTLGVVIYETRLKNATEETIWLPELAAGIYFINGYVNGTWIRTKFINQ